MSQEHSFRDYSEANIAPRESRLPSQRRKYTTAETAGILARPALQKVESSPKIVSLPSEERIKTPLKPSESLYQGAWFQQGGEETCLPWAVANSMMTIGETPPTELMKDMLNHSIGVDRDGENGMSHKAAIDLVKTHPEVNIILERKNFPQDFLGEEINYQDKAHDPYLQVNAWVIKQTIDMHMPVIVSIEKPTDIQESGHTVCIAGYKVTDEGFMDLQIIDSAEEDISLQPLETFSQQMIRTKTLILKKNVPLPPDSV